MVRCTRLQTCADNELVLGYVGVDFAAKAALPAKTSGQLRAMCLGLCICNTNQLAGHCSVCEIGGRTGSRQPYVPLVDNSFIIAYG